MSFLNCLGLVIILVCVVAMLLNPKIRNRFLLKDMLSLYTVTSSKMGKRKPYFYDIVCLLLLPISIGAALVWLLGCVLNDAMANVLITVTSILFSVLFTVLSILAAKSKSQDAIENRVAGETLSVITSVTMWLILTIVLLLTYLFALAGESSAPVQQILSCLIFSILIHSLGLLLIALKRFYLIFTKTNN